MFDECEVTFEGSRGGSYYVACNLVPYISENLTNTGSSSITLYPSINQGNSQNNITIPAVGYARYTSGTSTIYITNASKVTFNLASQYYRQRDLVEIVLLGLVVTITLIRMIFRGGR